MESALPDDLATVCHLVRTLAGQLDRQGEAMLRAELGSSLARFLVLAVVDAHPGDLNQQVIADRLGLSKGTVSRQIERAAQAGLMTVQVAAHTRRENTVALTPAGSELVRKGDAILQRSRAAPPGISPADLATTQRVLRTILTAME